MGRALPCGGSARRAVGCALIAFAVCLFLLPTVASANDSRLKATLAAWSRRITIDARSLQVSAQQRHPRQLTIVAGRFRVDALAAHRALLTVRPSSGRGTRARRLALGAFAQYALVGREWALAGRARLHKNRAEAIRHASLAKQHALRGGRLLISAGKLLA